MGKKMHLKYSSGKCVSVGLLASCDYQSFADCALDLITVLPWAIFFISNGDNIVAYNFTCFAADVRGQQVVTTNGASCPRC